VKTPYGWTAGVNEYRPAPYLSADVTTGADHFTHGALTSGTMSPPFASRQTETGVPQPAPVLRRAGAFPAVSSVASRWFSVVGST